jgi:hypothetical protein
MIAHTIAELAKAILNGESRIEVEGNLAKKTVKIKLVGPITWFAVAGSIAAGVILAVRFPFVARTPQAAAVGAASALIGSTVSVSALGLAGAQAAIAMAVAGGGVSVLNTLRNDYRIVDQSEGRLVLVRV